MAASTSKQVETLRKVDLFGLFASVVICAACSPFWVENLNNQFRAEGGMLVEPARQGVSRFVVTLSPEMAIKLQAPKGEAFLRLLEEKLRVQEVSSGHKYCEFGYKLTPMYWYKGVFASTSGRCLSNPAAR